MTIPFWKMHGLGNDFVVLDGRNAPLVMDDARAKAISDRKTGVGCDQFIVLEPSDTADLFMRIRNADGGEVDACGNATRCIAALLFHETGKTETAIETNAGLLRGYDNGDGMITVDMGPAVIDWQQIPLREKVDTLHVPLAIDVGTNGALEDAVAVNMGNPHAVFFVDDVFNVDLERVGPVLEHDPWYPERTNVNIAHLSGSDKLRHRVWERGVGITRACGTGACATAVAAVQRGLTSRKIEIELDGGILNMEWRESDDHVLMTGPAAISFQGTLSAELYPEASR